MQKQIAVTCKKTESLNFFFSQGTIFMKSKGHLLLKCWWVMRKLILIYKIIKFLKIAPKVVLCCTCFLGK